MFSIFSLYSHHFQEHGTILQILSISYRGKPGWKFKWNITKRSLFNQNCDQFKRLWSWLGKSNKQRARQAKFIQDSVGSDLPWLPIHNHATTRQRSIGRSYALHRRCTEGPTLGTPDWLQPQLRCMCRAFCVGKRKAHGLLSSEDLTDIFKCMTWLKLRSEFRCQLYHRLVITVSVIVDLTQEKS